MCKRFTNRCVWAPAVRQSRLRTTLPARSVGDERAAMGVVALLGQPLMTGAEEYPYRINIFNIARGIAGLSYGGVPCYIPGICIFAHISTLCQVLSSSKEEKPFKTQPTTLRRHRFTLKFTRLSGLRAFRH